MTTDEQIVDSSPTPVVEAVEPEAVETAPIETEVIPIEEYSREQRAVWLKTGVEPTRAKNAEPPPADAEKPTEPAPVKPSGKGADARIQQLLKERHELRTKLEAVEKAKQPEPTTPKEPAEGAPVEPKEADFETWDEFRSAERKYFKDLAKHEAQQVVRETQTQQKQQEASNALSSQWEEREAKFRESVPDFDVNAAAESISGYKNFQTMAGVIVREPQGPAIAHYLMENPEVAKQIGTADPIDAVRMITKIGLRFEAPAQPTASKPISKSGPPARDLTGNASPVDPIKKAIAEGDMTTYRKLMNAKEGRK